MSVDHIEILRDAAERRLLSAQAQREALDALNAAVHTASEGGMSAIAIAAAIGTTRQRVYEILRSPSEPAA